MYGLQNGQVNYVLISYKNGLPIRYLYSDKMRQNFISKFGRMIVQNANLEIFEFTPISEI
jgi:hypothetical protein